MSDDISKDTIIEDKQTGDIIVIPFEQDLKELYLQRALDCIKNSNTEKKWSICYNLTICFYVVGYYNRALYTEGKELTTVEEASVLDFYNIHSWPHIRGHKRISPPPKTVVDNYGVVNEQEKETFQKELDKKNARTEIANDIESLKRLLKQTETASIKSITIKYDDDSETIISDFGRKAILDFSLQAKIKNLVDVLNKLPKPEFDKPDTRELTSKEEQALNKKFKSGKLDLKTNCLEIIKRIWNRIDTETPILTLAENAYIVGYCDRAFKMEDLKLKKIIVDKPFENFLETVKNFLENKGDIL
jgi:hypothetical protein